MIFFFFLFPNYMFSLCFFFFFNDTATTEIYTLSLHERSSDQGLPLQPCNQTVLQLPAIAKRHLPDRKSTRLISSHVRNSYAVFCLKKKNVHVVTFFPVKARAAVAMRLNNPDPR